MVYTLQGINKLLQDIEEKDRNGNREFIIKKLDTLPSVLFVMIHSLTK